MDWTKYIPQYGQEIEKMAAFWLKFSIDSSFGGYFCVISAKGEITDTDKYVLWHGQQAYTFAKLYQQITPRPEWLEYAKNGADFLLQFASDSKGNWYATTDRMGHLVQVATDVQPEAFAAAAWGMLARVLTEEIYAETARKTLQKAFKKRDKMLLKWTEDPTGPRHLKNLNEWTALATALLACQETVSEKFLKEKAALLLTELTTHFWEPRADILLTNVPAWGGYWECEKGRSLQPGAAFEALSAGLDLARLLKKNKISKQLARQVQYIAQTTWDEKYGGFFQALDLKSLPLPNTTASHKLAEVQLNALVALQKAESVLNDHELFKLWQRTHDYLWQHFPDRSVVGEWVGVLNRHGEPLLELKATSHKCAYQTVAKIIDLTSANTREV
ncbi:MAG: hypothetical protein EAZ70_01275 [Runella slithyformis]|nr:MAG: hypothetical protein EAZ70_01275 [Runella slithyformis]TAF48564.1 MAG: hypothetical protein EAZ63_04665 [Runella slithyformis]TAF83365.1 MAG: hypothetical protein EAZ50_01720 [Runella slithyformis]